MSLITLNYQSKCKRTCWGSAVPAYIIPASRDYQPVGPSTQEVALKHRIDEIYTRWPFYGSRKIAVVLNQAQIAISRPTVQRCMREMGIAGIGPRPNLSKPGSEHKIYPYLLRNVVAEYPNHVWGVDITYIRLQGGWMYLVAIPDWFSRFVIGWELDQTLEMPFVFKAVDRALEQTWPVICLRQRSRQPLH